MSGDILMYDWHGGLRARRNRNVKTYSGPASMFGSKRVLRMPRYRNYVIAGAPDSHPYDFGLRYHSAFCAEFMCIKELETSATTLERVLFDFPGSPNDTTIGCPHVQIRYTENPQVIKLYWKTYANSADEWTLKSSTVTFLEDKWVQVKVTIDADGTNAKVYYNKNAVGWAEISFGGASTPAIEEDLDSSYCYLLGTSYADWARDNAPSEEYDVVYAPGLVELDWAYVKIGRTYDATTDVMTDAYIKHYRRFGYGDYITAPFRANAISTPDIFAEGPGVVLVSGVGALPVPTVGESDVEAVITATAAGVMSDPSVEESRLLRVTELPLDTERHVAGLALGQEFLGYTGEAVPIRRGV